jgi:hypothetical protein
MIRHTLVVIFATLTLSAGTNAGTISDGDFSNWSFSAFGENGGTATPTVFPSGGNPGAYLQILTNTGNISGSGDQAGISAIYLGDSTSAALSGAFELDLDVTSIGDSGSQGQVIDLMVDQAGTLYSDYLGATGVPSGWTTEMFHGTFLASDFANLSGSGPAQPDFSGGTQTYFGFFAGNETSNIFAQNYDNFSLSNQSLSSSPEPSSLYLIIGGALVFSGLPCSRHQRKRGSVARS